MKRYQNTCIVAVDAGYGNMKTANCHFPTGITRYDHPPIFDGNILEYDGAWYRIGEGHKAFEENKAADKDFYLLTLAAVAMELSRYCITDAEVHLATGLPLTWTGRDRESYRSYLLQNESVAFRMNGIDYHIRFTGCDVFAQGYPAVVPLQAKSPELFRGTVMLADIGNGTMNVLYLRDGRPDENRSWTELLGVNQCVLTAKKMLMDKFSIRLDEETIQQMILTGAADVSSEVQDCLKKVLRAYAERLLHALRDHGYDPRMMRLFVVGGGGVILERYGEVDKDRVTILNDICAAAKGFEYVALGLKWSRERR